MAVTAEKTRFAHKPVDALHRARLLKLGRWWVCRGCSALIGGSLAGLAVLVWRGPSLGLSVTIALACGAASLPRIYARLLNPMRDVVRAASGAAAVWSVAAAARRGGVIDATFLLWAMVVLAFFVRRARRGVVQ